MCNVVRREIDPKCGRSCPPNKEFRQKPHSQTPPPSKSWHSNFLMLGPHFPPKYREKAKHKEFRKGVSSQNSLCWNFSRALFPPESRQMLSSRPKRSNKVMIWVGLFYLRISFFYLQLVLLRTVIGLVLTYNWNLVWSLLLTAKKSVWAYGSSSLEIGFGYLLTVLPP